MKLSMIICMKQWDKQGQEGSRCELSRNLCSGVILVRAVVASAVGWAPHPGIAAAQLRGGSLMLSHPSICPAELRVPVERRAGFDGAG